MTFRDTTQIIDEPGSDTTTEQPPVDLGKIDTLHELLALAIGDFEKVIANPRYSINLETWHQPLDNGKCSVCLAGSVMAMHLGTKPHVSRSASVIGCFEGFEDPNISRRLNALNCLRAGNILQALVFIDPTCEISPLAETLSRKWSGKVRCSNARTRPQARLLLADLKLMQRDLKAAGL